MRRHCIPCAKVTRTRRYIMRPLDAGFLPSCAAQTGVIGILEVRRDGRDAETLPEWWRPSWNKAVAESQHQRSDPTIHPLVLKPVALL
jgi:hypothetical protein